MFTILSDSFHTATRVDPWQVALERKRRRALVPAGGLRGWFRAALSGSGQR